MGNGQLFLPVKSEIRKKIGKQEGDSVRIVLYKDDLPLETPEEIIACFSVEPPKAFETFMSFSESERKYYLNWVYDAKTEDTKANRIVKMIDRLMEGKKFYEP